MKILETYVNLSCSIKIYVPSTINVDQPLDNSHWVNLSLSLLAEQFGGASANIGIGAWISKTGELIKEPITFVYAFCTKKQLEKSIKLVRDFCLTMKNSLNQEAIAIESNGKLYLI